MRRILLCALVATVATVGALGMPAGPSSAPGVAAGAPPAAPPPASPATSPAPPASGPSAALPGPAAGVAGAPPGPASVAAARPGPTRRVVDVALVAPAGFAPDRAVTAQDARRLVRDASDYWAEQTGGRVGFTPGRVTGWYRSAVSCREIDALWAEAHERLGQSPARNRHLLVVVPRGTASRPGCPFGYGSYGRGESGGDLLISEPTPSLLAHEIGHNLGLGHAGALVCAGAADATFDEGWPQGCTERGYDDLFDVMGYSGAGFGGGALGAIGLDRLGAEPQAVLRLGVGEHRVSLPALALARGPARVARVAEAADAVYYLEYRAPVGRDAGTAASAWRPTFGLRVLRRDPRPGGRGGFELDATPHTTRPFDRALPVGGTFTSASGRLSVTLLGADADHADVQVTLRGPGPGRGTPGV